MAPKSAARECGAPRGALCAAALGAAGSGSLPGIVVGTVRVAVGGASARAEARGSAGRSAVDEVGPGARAGSGPGPRISARVEARGPAGGSAVVVTDGRGPGPRASARVEAPLATTGVADGRGFATGAAASPGASGPGCTPARAKMRRMAGAPSSASGNTMGRTARGSERLAGIGSPVRAVSAPVTAGRVPPISAATSGRRFSLARKATPSSAGVAGSPARASRACACAVRGGAVGSTAARTAACRRSGSSGAPASSKAASTAAAAGPGGRFSAAWRCGAALIEVVTGSARRSTTPSGEACATFSRTCVPGFSSASLLATNSVLPRATRKRPAVRARSTVTSTVMPACNGGVEVAAGAAAGAAVGGTPGVGAGPPALTGSMAKGPAPNRSGP